MSSINIYTCSQAELLKVENLGKTSIAKVFDLRKDVLEGKRGVILLDELVAIKSNVEWAKEIENGKLSIVMPEGLSVPPGFVPKAAIDGSTVPKLPLTSPLIPEAGGITQELFSKHQSEFSKHQSDFSRHVADVSRSQADVSRNQAEMKKMLESMFRKMDQNSAELKDFCIDKCAIVEKDARSMHDTALREIERCNET